jgi:hypothetical protein
VSGQRCLAVGRRSTDRNGFAKQSGGQVRIYSEPGCGTMACLYLPRYHGEGRADDADIDDGTVPTRRGAGTLPRSAVAAIATVTIDKERRTFG